MKVIGHYNPEKKINVINSFMKGVRRDGHDTEIFLVNSEEDKVIVGDYHIILGWNRFSIKFLNNNLLSRIVICDPGLRDIDYDFRSRVSLDSYYMLRKTKMHNFTPYKPTSSDRWDLFNEKFNFKIKPWREKGEHIVIAHKPESGYFEENYQNFYIEAIKKSIMTGRKVICCGHPRYNKRCKKWKKYITLKNKFKGTSCEFVVGVDKYLRNAHCLIAASGSTVVRASLYGIPAYSYEKHSLIDPISYKNLDKFLKDPPTPKRNNWFNWISYQHWTLGEMKRGLPWKYLTE